MIHNPLFIASVLTLLAAVPLYFLGATDYQLSLERLPLGLLSLFVLLLLAAFWSRRPVAEAGQKRPTAGAGKRETGKVKWFNASKGFGFITSDNGEDVFVHFRSIRGSGHRSLRDGQRVDFIVSEGEKGLQAEDVAIAR